MDHSHNGSGGRRGGGGGGGGGRGRGSNGGRWRGSRNRGGRSGRGRGVVGGRVAHAGDHEAPAGSPKRPRRDVELHTEHQQKSGEVQTRTTSTTLGQLTETRFASLDVSPFTKEALSTVFKYENMTKVQANSIPVCLTGRDVLAKAKTGTGKTISFLVPSIEMIVRIPAKDRRGISVLVISPTRELAQQIEEEAKILIRFHKGLSAGCIVGGTNIKKDLSMLQKGNPPSILVATVGRLNDHLDNYKLSSLMGGLKVLVFDEADQMLDMGFRPAIELMLKSLPPKHTRQTLMFSATMPTDVKSIAKIAMRDENDFMFVDTVGKEESTHQHVAQTCTVTSLANHTAELVRMVQLSMKAPDYKVMVFFTTARLTQLYAELFNAMGIKVLEIHSRKSQGHRNKAADAFRTKSSVIMFSSDVSARGMDYPDVSTVIQVGTPSDRAQYIHRLGRTARAGKQGNGLLLLCEFEQFFLKIVKDLPITQSSALTDVEAAQYGPAILAGLKSLNQLTLEMGYQAWMGFYNSSLRKIGWSKQDLVATANLWINDVMHFKDGPPGLKPKTIGKMGLKGVPGIKISRDQDHGFGGRGGGRGGRGRGGRR